MLSLKQIIKIKFALFVCFVCVLFTFSFALEEKDLLEMTLEELMNVKITTAARSPEKIGDIPASVVLITRKDIETFGYRTLEEILENIPGLFGINDYGEDGMNFGIRGFWSGVANDNMIIQVNGISQAYNIHFNFPLSKINVPVEAIEKIEVIRGPMSVIYGNGAFYGAINIITNDALSDDSSDIDENDFTKTVTVSLGSEKTKKFFARIAGHEGDFNYILNASIFDTYGMDHPLSDMVRVPSVLPVLYGVPENHTTGGRLEKNQKYFNFTGIFKEFNLDISYNESINEINFFFPSYSDGTLSRIFDTRMALSYRKRLSDIITIDGKFTYSHNRVWGDFDFLFEDFHGIQQLESSAWELDLNAFITASAALDIKTGLYYQSILDASNMYDLPSFGSSSFVNNYFYLPKGYSIETRAFYTQINYNPISNLTLVGGIRLEQMPKYGLEAILAGGTEDFKKVKNIYDQDEVEIIPRVAAIFKLNDRNIFKFLYGQAINRPSFFQNTQNLLLEPSKGTLKPESIRTLELNYISSFSSNFTLNTSIFYNTLDNLITRVAELDEQGNYQNWSANAGKMVTHGVELTINAEPFKNFRVELSGTFQETEDKRPDFRDIEVAYSPKILGYLKASYRSRNFTLAVTGNYVGAMETFWDETLENEDGTFGRRIGDRVDGYFVLGTNLRLDKLFNTELYFNLRCSNLLNEEIRYPTFTNNPWADRGTLGIGRTILASIGWKF